MAPHGTLERISKAPQDATALWLRISEIEKGLDGVHIKYKVRGLKIA